MSCRNHLQFSLFYKIFVELENELDIKVHPQLNLASVIKKETSNRYINELFRNIDFGIFTKKIVDKINHI